MAENKFKFMVKKGMAKIAFSWVALMFFGPAPLVGFILRDPNVKGQNPCENLLTLLHTGMESNLETEEMIGVSKDQHRRPIPLWT